MSTSEKKSVLSANLKEIRTSKKMTQQEMAGFLGINHRTYQNYEGGKSAPPLNKLQVIAKKLSLNVSDLTGEIDTFKDNLRLKNTRLYTNYLMETVSEKEDEREKIEELIKVEEKPEKLRELFEKTKAINLIIENITSEIVDYENRIDYLCSKLGKDANKLEPIKEEEENDIFIINVLKHIDNNLNSIIKTELIDFNAIENQVIDGKLQYYKELFSIDDLLFYEDAFALLSKIKMYIQDQGELEYERRDFINLIAKFFSNENIGLDVQKTKENLNELMDRV